MVDTVILVRESFTEKMTFESRSEGGGWGECSEQRNKQRKGPERAGMFKE